MSFRNRPALSFLIVVLLLFAGCGGSEGDSSATEQFDRARAWVEQQSAVVKDVGEMIDAYERNDMKRAAAEMDSLRGKLNWEELGSPQMRDRILTIGTEVYAALDRTEDAARLIENALPHLDGELRTQWDELRARLEDGSIPRTLDSDASGEAVGERE
ncbi:hypothetical protein CRI94_03905 [Longibacter salinarum]|uniref:Photosystem II protein PsbQ n=1 Tax=Longibacter salinarum TaxID=1850348 RepID=A0A2A8CZX6_9BACT|nr:hypothetical protein [Longibacter salinarum]PEN14194.1 hypothetical protein CRI94_03905 [Longibacter salinarum]